jgi:Uma2 family endonuclease
MTAARILDLSDDVQADAFEELTNDRQFRYEQVGNLIYMMGKASRQHQDILSIMHAGTFIYLDGKECRVYQANTGVDWTSFVDKLKETANLKSFLEKREAKWREENIEKRKDKQFPLYLDPDMMVVCDWFDGDWGSEGYKGVPRLIVEVTSPSTVANDYSWKKDIYEALGVQEYWIIDIVNDHKIIRYNFADGRYAPHYFSFGDKAASLVFEGLTLDFSKMGA